MSAAPTSTLSSSSSSSTAFIRTTTNFISRQALIEGPQNVEMRGRSIVDDEVTIRGDLAPIRVGHFCYFAAGSVLSPPSLHLLPTTERKKPQTQEPRRHLPQQQHPPPNSPGVKASHIPMCIGSMTSVGRDAVVQAAAVGACVEVGDNAVISARCILKDGCRIAPNTVLAPDTVVPPFALVAGRPGQIVGELPPSVMVMRKEAAQGRYRRKRRWILEGGVR